MGGVSAMTKQKPILYVVICLCLAPTICVSNDVFAAPHARSSVRSFSAGPSVRGSSVRVTGGSPIHSAVRTGNIHSSRSTTYGNSPARVVSSVPLHNSMTPSIRSTDRVRISPRTSNHPIVREPGQSVGRTTHLIHSVVRPYDRWAYGNHNYYRYHWYPYYYFGFGIHSPWYSYHRPWCYDSWYDPWWGYPYYSGWYFPYYDPGWNGWGFSATYQPQYEYPDDPPVEVTERVIRPGTSQSFDGADMGQAARLFGRGRYAEAAEVCRRLSLTNQKDPLVRLSHVQCLIADERYDYAAYILKQTIDLNPDWNEIFMRVRGYYPDWGIFVSQLSQLERYISEKPNDADAKFLLAYTYLFSDRRHDAATVLRGILDQHPKDNAAHAFLRLAEADGKPSETNS